MASSPFDKFSKWLKLKIYQIELNFSVYMFTPWERIVFCAWNPPLRSVMGWPIALLLRFSKLTELNVGSITFLLFSLTFIAAILYLPQHIIFIVTRAWFYINGENVDVVEVAKEAVETLVHHHGSVSSSTIAAAKETVAGVVREL